MKIELDGIALDTIQGSTDGVSEGRSVSNINTADKRNIDSQDSPGAQGSSHQDLGRMAVVVSFDGTLLGPNATSIIEQIRSRFKKGDPVPFLSDLSGTADITKVIIDSFNVKDTVGAKDRYDYSIILKEYKEPPEEPEAPAVGTGAGGPEEESEEAAKGEEGAEGKEGEGEIEEEKKEEETEADKEAKEKVEEEAKNSDEGCNIVTGEVRDENDQPMKGVCVKINGPEDREVYTDENGVYTAENLPPGEYTVTVDAEGHEGGEDKFNV